MNARDDLNRRDNLDAASDHLDRAGDQTSDAARHMKQAGHEVKEALEAGAAGTLGRTREAAREVGRTAESVAESAADTARAVAHKAGHVAERVSHAESNRDLERRADSTTEKVLDKAGQALSGAAPTVGRGAEAVVGAAGSALHFAGGALGTVVGKIAGRVGGWWNTASEAIAELPEEEHQACLLHFEAYTPRPADMTFETALPGYGLGYVAARNPDYRGRRFEDIEPDLRHGFNTDLDTEYPAMRDFARFGYERGTTGL
jgi:hypothetical protein